MRLLLTVLGPQRGTLGERSTHVFDEAGGSIGRSASCDWVLPDERNMMSARHARISHNGRGFLITDTSTNGVYLNTVNAPLGRDQSAPLANGDTVYLADYIVSAAILREEPARPVTAPVAAMPAPAPGFVGIPNQGAMPVPAMPLPVAAPAPAAILPQLDFTAPPPAAPISVPAPMPAAPAGAPTVIPDDFDFSDLGAPRTTPAAPIPAPAPPPMPLPLPMAPPPPTAPELPQGTAVDPLALLRQRAMARAASIDLTPQEPGTVPPAPAARAIPDVATPGALPGAPKDEAHAFWAALGFDAGRIPPEARERLLIELGGALREAAGGLVAVLAARKSMKDEFRVEQTRLAPRENNPFKFFASGDEALRRIVVDSAPGFLPLDFAVTQCFADIQAHEVAITSAMQGGIRKLLDRLAPAALEAEAEPGLLGRRPDKSRLWERYAELHAELAGDLDRTIREFVSHEFARASAQPGAKS